MMRLHVGERLEDLAGVLAGALSEPLADPMEPELLVVPTAGVRRWLSLELSRHLGASGPHRGDGIAANIEMIFPGALLPRVLGYGDDDDPWSLGHLSWVILALPASGNGHPEGTDLPGQAPPPPAPGVTRWARARRIADLFDRYMTHRPEMIRAWAHGDDSGGTRHRLPEGAAWQPALWRAVRHRIGVPSPPELMGDHLRALRAGAATPDLPARVSLFGMTTIPGGTHLLEVLDALATSRDVGLYLHQPSVALASQVATQARHDTATQARHDIAAQPRAADESADLAKHPLLRSWGRPAREAILILGDHYGQATLRAAGASQASTLLERLQADIRANRAPSGDPGPALTDGSIVIHACQGDTRQVEVLRDQILHLLSDDRTLTEEDIVVLCPSLQRFTPVIESVLGQSATGGGDLSGDQPIQDGSTGPPALRYAVTDLSLGSTYPLLSAMGSLVMLLGSRFSDVALLDFAGLPPVRRAFGLDDDDLATLADWIEQANIRWGLDAGHRVPWGIPDTYEAGTWKRGLQRILVGITTSCDAAALAHGNVAPIAVEGSGVATAGRVADLLARLGAFADRVRSPLGLDEWLELLRTASDTLMTDGPDRTWGRERLEGIFEQIAVDAEIPRTDEQNRPDEAGRSGRTQLSLADVQHLLGDHLGVTAGGPRFFKGGITISSPTPLRGIPHRVICLLGMDESSFGPGSPDGDDLISAEPRVGDRDRRFEMRQVLLDSVLAAGDHLVILRNGHSVVTNQEIPPAVVVDEIIDAVGPARSSTEREAFERALTTVHPRHRFDELNFLPGEIVTSVPSTPWSFDGTAQKAAESLRGGGTDTRFVRGRIPEPVSRAGRISDPSTIALGDLREFLVSPPKFFLRRVLGMSLPDPVGHGTDLTAQPVPGSNGLAAPAPGRDLVIEVKGLERWGVRNRMLGHLLEGGDIRTFEVRELASDRLAPGSAGRSVIDEAHELVGWIVDAVSRVTDLDLPSQHIACDLVLSDGTRIVGTARDDLHDPGGPLEVTVSELKDKDLLTTWLDLLVLTAAFPQRPWQAVHISQGTSGSKKGKGATECTFRFSEEDPAVAAVSARDALGRLAELYRLGLREPLPFFPATSRSLAVGKPKPSHWVDGHSGRGEGTDIWVRTAFGDATFEQLTSMPIESHDPSGGAGDRARLYAELIWGAYETTAPGDKRTVW